MSNKLREKIDAYEEMLVNCIPRKSESAFQKVVDSYEDDLLELDGFPEEYFDFVLRVLSDARFYSKAGAWNFLLAIGTEKHKLQPHHYQALADKIIGNYNNYLNEDLCLAVCDFVARNYPYADAKPIFDQLILIENDKSSDLHGFVNDGLRILEAEKDRVQASSTKH